MWFLLAVVELASHRAITTFEEANFTFAAFAFIFRADMSTNLRIDSFADINIVERGVLASDVDAGASTLDLIGTDGFAEGQTVYVGQLAREGIEKAVVEAVLNPSELTLVEGLKLAHARSEPVTAVLGDRIKIYRAPNVNGQAPAAESYTLLTTRTIDADQLSTYYRDADGSSAYWYTWTYYNVDTEAETDRSEPIRGDDFEHYASLTAIRKAAGFQNAYNLADSLVDEARRQAQSEINSALGAHYAVPFNPTPEIIRTLTIQLAAALLKLNQGMGNQKAIDTLRAQLQAYADGDGSITGEDGSSPLLEAKPTRASSLKYRWKHSKAIHSSK